jgi:predicted CoA-binding protein
MPLRRPTTDDERKQVVAVWPDNDETLRRIFDSCHTWAVVGCSPDPRRDSRRVATYLQSIGYRVIPVRPDTDELLGERCYPDLASIPADTQVDCVDVFRRSSEAGAHVDEAITVGARAVWLQLGVIDEDAARRAADAGLDVVMDHCPHIDHPRLYGR